MYPVLGTMAPPLWSFRQIVQFVAVLWVIIPTDILLADEPGFDTIVRDFIAEKKFSPAEQVLTRHLESYPENLEARFLRARVFAWNREYDESLADYEFLRERDPYNLDYVLGTARVLIWAGRPDDAAILLEYERPLWASNEEIWKLELQALANTDSLESQRYGEELMQQALELFPESAWIEGFPAYFDRSNQRYVLLAAGFALESLSNDRGNRKETHLSGAYHFDTRNVIYAGLRKTDRFGIRDTEASLGGYFPLTEKWTANLGATISPDAIVLPTSSVVARLHRRLPLDWGVGFSIRRTEYEKTSSNIATASIERYWKDYRFVYRLSRGKTDQADTTLSHELRGDYYYQDGSMVALAIGDGTESEIFRQASLITTNVTFLSLFGLHKLRSGWSVFWKLGHIRQGNLYDSKGAGIELQYKF